MNRISRALAGPSRAVVIPEPRTCCRCGGPFLSYSGTRETVGPCCRPQSRSDHLPVPPKPFNRPGQPLTPRQRQIAALVAEGLSNKEIAFRLRLTYGTVKVLCTQIYIRMEVEGRVALARAIWEQERAA